MCYRRNPPLDFPCYARFVCVHGCSLEMTLPVSNVFFFMRIYVCGGAGNWTGGVQHGVGGKELKATVVNSEFRGDGPHSPVPCTLCGH